MNGLLVKTNQEELNNTLHTGVNTNNKDKQLKAVMTYFIVKEAKETENFYTIDDLIINHMVRNNYRFDIKLIDDSCQFVDAYLIELILLENDINKKTICYINKETYKELQNNYLVINN